MTGQIAKIIMQFKDKFSELANSVYFNLINPNGLEDRKLIIQNQSNSALVYTKLNVSTGEWLRIVVVLVADIVALQFDSSLLHLRILPLVEHIISSHSFDSINVPT